MLRTVLNFFLFFFILNLSSAILATAQTPADLTKALAKLDHDLERARELVHSFNNQRAIKLVQEAQQLRDQAVNLLSKDRPTRRDFIEAAAKIKLAQARLVAAAKLALDGPVRRLRSQLEELLRRADESVPHSRNREAQRTLNEAKKNRDSGERAAAAMSPDRAAEHFRVGITLAERSIQLANRVGDAVIDALRDEKRKFEVLRDRTHQIIGEHGNKQSVQIFQQALRTYDSAEATVRNGNVELSRRLLNQAILLLLRASDLAQTDSPGSTDEASRALHRVQESLEEARETINASHKPAAKAMFQRALKFTRDAEAAARAGNTKEALTKIGIAKNIIRRALRLSAVKPQRKFNDKVIGEIENTRGDIKAVRQNLGPDSPRDAQTLLRMSEFALRRAEKASGAGLGRVALEAVLAAQRFLSRAESVAKGAGPNYSSHEQTAVRLQQLETAISDAESRIMESEEEWSRQLLQSAKDIKRLAGDSFEQQNYRAANEGIQVSFELLRKSLKYLPKN